jgi:hypothetical protein
MVEITHLDLANSFYEVQQALVHIAAVTLCWMTGMIVSTKDEHVLLEILPEHFLLNMYARRDCNAAPVSAANNSQEPLSLVCAVGEISTLILCCSCVCVCVCVCAFFSHAYVLLCAYGNVRSFARVQRSSALV